MAGFLLSLILDNWQAVVGILATGAAFLVGQSRAKSKHISRKAKADAKAHERINKLDPIDPADRRDIDQRLRDHSE